MTTENKGRLLDFSSRGLMEYLCDYIFREKPGLNQRTRKADIFMLRDMWREAEHAHEVLDGPDCPEKEYWQKGLAQINADKKPVI